MQALIMNPETLEAASKVLNAAPIDLNSAVIHCRKISKLATRNKTVIYRKLTKVVATTIIQKVKKIPASVVNPTIKYKMRENTETWNRMTGISAAIWAMQKAAGWK